MRYIMFPKVIMEKKISRGVSTVRTQIEYVKSK